MPSRVPDSCRRVVIDKDPALARHPEFNFADQTNKTNKKKADQTNGRDVFLQGDIDEMFLDIINELGWLAHLQSESCEDVLANLAPQSQRNLEAYLAGMEQIQGR